MLVDPPDHLFTPRAKIGGLTCDRRARSSWRRIPPANKIEMACQPDDTAGSLDFDSRLRLGARPDFCIVLCEHAAEIHEVTLSRDELLLKWGDSKDETTGWKRPDAQKESACASVCLC